MKLTIGTTSIFRDQCLERLLKTIEDSDFEGRVIVGDQNPRRKPDFLNNFSIDYLNLDFDIGVTGAKNRVVSKVESPFFLWLDDDITFDLEAARQLVEDLKEKPDFGWISPNFYEMKKGNFLSHAANWTIEDKILTRYLVSGKTFQEVDQPSTVGIFRTKIFDEISFFEQVKICREHLFFAWRFNETRWKGGADLSVAFGHGGCFSTPKFCQLREDRRRKQNSVIQEYLGLKGIKDKYE